MKRITRFFSMEQKMLRDDYYFFCTLLHLQLYRLFGVIIIKQLNLSYKKKYKSRKNHHLRNEIQKIFQISNNSDFEIYAMSINVY